MDTPLIGRLVSINVGGIRAVEWFDRTVATAIWKDPVEGPVAVELDHIDGDQQADLRVHGGPDKAVYAYAAEDLAWWASQGQAVAPGMFGENLTTEGVDVTGSVIGDRWSVGTAVLEVCQPREPCFKLGIRVGDAAFVQQFGEARRPGAYLRVIEPGVIERGDPITLSYRPDDELTLTDLLDAEEGTDPELLRRIVRSELTTEGWRHRAERALNKLP